MPPWVGSGWTQITVATVFERFTGLANSPTMVNESDVIKLTCSRVAGSTEFGEIIVTIDLADPENFDVSNMACANDAFPLHPAECPPAMQQHAGSPAEFHGHTRGTDRFLSRQIRLIYAHATHHRDGTQ